MNNEITKFDIKKKEWSEIKAKGDIPEKRAYHFGVQYKDYMYVYGGSNTHILNEKTKFFYDMFRFSFLNNFWEKVEYKGTPPIVSRRYNNNFIFIFKFVYLLINFYLLFINFFFFIKFYFSGVCLLRDSM